MYSKENKNYHNDLNHSISPEGTETGEITIHLWVVLSTSLCCSGQVVPYRSDLSVHLDVTQRTWAKRGSCYRKWERPVVTWADSSDERESLKRRRCEFKSLENTHGLVVKKNFVDAKKTFCVFLNRCSCHAEERAGRHVCQRTGFGGFVPAGCDRWVLRLQVFFFFFSLRTVDAKMSLLCTV